MSSPGSKRDLAVLVGTLAYTLPAGVAGGIAWLLPQNDRWIVGVCLFFYWWCVSRILGPWMRDKLNTDRDHSENAC